MKKRIVFHFDNRVRKIKINDIKENYPNKIYYSFFQMKWRQKRVSRIR